MPRTPIHPGEILADELEEIRLSAKKLADVIEVPPNRLYQLLAGRRSVTADTALRLSRYFGMSADFWMNLQSAYELDLAPPASGVKPYNEFPSAAKQENQSPRYCLAPPAAPRTDHQPVIFEIPQYPAYGEVGISHHRTASVAIVSNDSVDKRTTLALGVFAETVFNDLSKTVAMKSAAGPDLPRSSP